MYDDVIGVQDLSASLSASQLSQTKMLNVGWVMNFEGEKR